MIRARWYVVDPRRRNRAAVLWVRWEWLARLVCVVHGRLDYGKAGSFHKSGGAR